MFLLVVFGLFVNLWSVTIGQIGNVNDPFGTGSINTGNNANNNPFNQNQPNQPFSGSSVFGNDNSNGQSPRITQFNYNDINWFNVDRRDEENWNHLYPFGERYWDSEIGRQSFGARPWHDRQIDLDFFMPYYGFRFNYTFLFPEGFIAFSYPWYIQPPYSFPIKDWPTRPDPSLIAAYMSPASFMHFGDVGISRVWFRVVERPNSLIQQRARGGQTEQRNFDANSREKGIVHRRSDGSPSHTRYGNAKLRISEGRVEDPALLDQMTNDLHEAMVGTRGFIADYALIVTWERMGYGGAPKSTSLGNFDEFKRWQNTYQMAILTDEIRTYSIFNYGNINWTSSTEAGSLAGRGGRQSAVVGFNGGNGTGFYHMPYSAGGDTYKLVEFGSAPTAGRWTARVDEMILYGGCTNNTEGPLLTDFGAYSMMGGFSINVSGPCFKKNHVVKFQIDKPEVDCRVISMSVARCTIPVDQIRMVGFASIALSIDGGSLFPYTGAVYLAPLVRDRSSIALVQDPSHADDNWWSADANNLTLKWPARNISYNPSDTVDIIAWGYWENTLRAQFTEVAMLAENVPNNGIYFFDPKVLRQSIKQRDRNVLLLDDAWERYNFGQIEVRISGEYVFSTADEREWSEVIPFPWLFKDEWEREAGSDWALEKCIDWFEWDGKRTNYVQTLETSGLACPCIAAQAEIDFGRFMPLIYCDASGDSNCGMYSGASGCYQSRNAAPDGAGQLCCYDAGGWLMFSQDYEYNPDYPNFMAAGGAQRAHLWGSPPQWRPPYIATYSNFYNDLMPWQFCCNYVAHCELYHMRRETSTCQNYNVSATGFAYGEPHFITYDGTKYTFNGKGYYVLSAMKSPVHDLMIQVRMEQPPKNIFNELVMASVISGVAATDNGSDTVEVFARREFRRWRYRMDIYVNKRRIFFDKDFKKYQLFNGLSILSPARNFDTSEIVIMFDTGVGVRVSENRGLLDVAVSLPPSYLQIHAKSFQDEDASTFSIRRQTGLCDEFYRTFGLLGAYNGVPEDDLENPECQITQVNYPPDESTSTSVFDNFGQKYRADGKHFSPIFDVNQSPIYTPLTFSDDYQRAWRPIFDPRRVATVNTTFAYTLSEVEVACQGSFACLYDYLVLGRREIAMDTLGIERKDMSIKSEENNYVSCGPLQKNQGILKYPAGKNYLKGITVKMACQPEFFIHGDQSRTCQNGTWSPGWWTWCRSRTEEYALKYATGIISSLLIIGLIAAIFVCCYLSNIKNKKNENQRVQRVNQINTITVTNTERMPNNYEQKQNYQSHEPSYAPMASKERVFETSA